MNKVDPHAFARFLADVDYGSLLKELSEKQNDLIASIEDADAAGIKSPGGTLTLKITYKKSGNEIEVRPDITIKQPKKVYARSIFFATPENNLTRQDPRQRELELRTLEGPTLRAFPGA